MEINYSDVTACAVLAVVNANPWCLSNITLQREFSAFKEMVSFEGNPYSALSYEFTVTMDEAAIKLPAILAIATGISPHDLPPEMHLTVEAVEFYRRSFVAAQGTLNRHPPTEVEVDVVSVLRNPYTRNAIHHVLTLYPWALNGDLGTRQDTSSYLAGTKILYVPPDDHSSLSALEKRCLSYKLYKLVPIATTLYDLDHRIYPFRSWNPEVTMHVSAVVDRYLDFHKQNGTAARYFTYPPV